MATIRTTILLGSMLALLQSGCGQQEQPIPTHILYGTVTSTKVDASGSWAYMRLVASGGQEDSVQYSTSCQLSGPGCSYQILFVEEGRYTVMAFIDLNDDAQPESPAPNAGDLAAVGRPLVLWDKTEMNFEDDLWREVL